MASMHSVCQFSEEEKTRVARKGYKIMRILAQGSCSLVYLCDFKKPKFDDEEKENTEELPTRLVCKVMESETAPKDFVQKFLPRELANLCRIRCGKLPHIIHVHSILQYKTKVMIFMRYAELGNLCDYIKNHNGFLTERAVRFWFRQLAIALSFLHTMEVAHRDIKCENILLTANFNVKLCDFGFSRLSIDAKGKPIYSTTYCGSVGYAAPELLKGIPYNPKISDVWSLGVVLFAMLNAAMPFAIENPTQLWAAQNKKAYQFRSSVSNRVSQDVVDLVAGMLEPNLSERLTITDVLNSPWLMSTSPSQQMLALESEAMKVAEQIRKDGLKPIKKILEMNLFSQCTEVIDEEKSTPISELAFPEYGRER